MLLWIVKNINPVHQFVLNAPLTTVNCTIKPTIPDTNNCDFIKMLCKTYIAFIYNNGSM